MSDATMIIDGRAWIESCRRRPDRSLTRWTWIGLKMLRNLSHGTLIVVLPDGRAFRFESPGEGPEATILMRDQKMARRWFTGGLIGWSESYLDGEWDSPDTSKVVELFSLNMAALEKHIDGTWWSNLLGRVLHALNRNTQRGSQRNIAYHYDLGNDFYRRWLDPSMTYSSAVFEGSQQDLESAQLAKYRRICTLLDSKPGQHVLEIGCGWGGFAEVAAGEFGLKVTGITLSREQHDYAVERIRKAGLSDRVDIRLQDYRDVTEKFDRIASIEMFEAVGAHYWPTFFGKLKDCLKPDGKAAMQVITIADDRFEGYRRSPDFIQRYIFPGGMLPSDSILRNLVSEAGLDLTRDDGFGQDYALTLRHWVDSFRAAWPEISEIGFDERFRRMWEFYLYYCEGAFRSGGIDVRQIAFSRKG
ncbi:MAG: cyclopropane-fatty-acyl-phospholipid synthase family protein [Alphaproteobacteria bacterium]|nr:cyclopropane-fatty-acyl-phospholipid synthase family protein [Alphaproteobacteria bacterium]MBU0797881.1 cyclopropane-fatty-acyl-phospholipid synthase family protein [Alphaproteobacteria bacterium]MBU0886167.1 cyclopropane-fatty-acyl-phospholipid synthase family protein [Alphaproteobacteria bacterium]MBU1812807.1 cyclopropane-fatty-acyl-phospholipid synthase family protein [Alphaproteobacteria bacterium]MBU2091188.1 cyclopropane-fatty-acyl-phospholipid synthase family protein [Alphaproteobac